MHHMGLRIVHSIHVHEYVHSLPLDIGIGRWCSGLAQTILTCTFNFGTDNNFIFFLHLKIGSM